MNPAKFDDLTDIFEATIDWDKRLAHEAPFYRRLVDQVGARSILDVACGTGHHAAMFRSWGLRVQGADLSQSMLDHARQRHGESADLAWVLRGYDQPIDPPGSFDLAICVGNSLALAPDLVAAAQGLARMMEAVRPGGAIVVHVLNLWKLPDGPCVWQKVRRATIGGGEVIIHKGVHRCGDCGYVELIVTPVAPSPELRSDSVRFLGIDPDWIQEQARAAGAQKCALFGGYHGEPWQREKSQDLILVAQK